MSSAAAQTSVSTSSTVARRYDAIVLGLGGVGSATLYQLARRGVRTLGLDRFPAGHARGSSHGETRIIRQAYFEHSDYVPLLLRAYELWSELEQQSQRQLFYRVGLLQAGPQDGVVIPGVLRSAKEHGLAVETLSAAAVARRFPALYLPPENVGVFERSAGYLRVEECVKTHLDLALQSGAEARFDLQISSWEAVEGGYAVHTSAGTFHARRLAIAAGAWSDSLVADIGVPLQVLRKHLHWFRTRDRHCHRDSGCPTFFYELPRGMFYGFPQIDDLGIKVAEHSGGEPQPDPLQDPRTVDPVDLQRVTEFCQEFLRGVTTTSTQHAVCFYTMSPDSHFIVDRHPQFPDVAFAAGLSGHGFKFTSVIGQILTDLLCDGGTLLPAEFLGLARFRQSP